MTRQQHCRPVSRVPAVAQTSLQVKQQALDTILTEFTNFLDAMVGVLDVGFVFLDAIGGLVGSVGGFIERLELLQRQEPWKTSF